MKNISTVLAVMGIAALMTGCSAESQRISQEKSEVNAEKVAQKALIDDRTSELKRNIDLGIKRAEIQIDDAKRQPGADQMALDAQKDNLKKNAETAKASLDQQNTECKKTVDSNVKTLEAQLDNSAKSGKLQ
jgi:hypothetical protein